ncbi:ATP-dependent DNA helicase [Corynebacterium pygosceleis]|uniref:ATP-dependent helicase DinG n=1 Tax=Corynebacterium pygosceleis TaxID=2800406 RepID=A0A9Q4CC69_9CORY|nr:ATP-dependent DNA helicase [Corynebacterium pygosceleis]MCK7638537.1 ATP-dependent DNA helicase [Corynebacterium pygosceleis]MCK7676315.1 ATP-dependent DNA helicase [Corynebacterium pygosceleis]MCL0121526.1 ATP-dependent DNA helicase [Corynebacterium pygosceleis]MCX7469320.1 ATP-dependent DNA helicase [Corynebacterium pygosceleis]
MPDSALSPDTAQLLGTAVSAIGGTTRPGQVAMLNAVTKAMREERHLAVQAGTGTGKSLAYLIPALAHAQATGTTVVVSTATIALQRQLVERDLPRLADALEPVMGRRPTFAILKGRSNYLCLNKISQPEASEEALIDEADLSWMGRHIVRLNEWAQETESGDRDSLDPGVPDLAWKQVSVTARECLGANRCPHGEDCFAESARRQAQDVDVVVTNHALLAIDALSEGTILPEHDVVVIDEAHELDGRITAVATAEISGPALTLLAKRAGKLGAEGRDEKVSALAGDWEKLSAAMPEGRWNVIDPSATSLLTALRDALWSLRQSIARSPDGEVANDPATAAERQSVATALQETHDSIVRVLEVFATADPTKQQDVVWLNRDDRRGDTLRVAPLSVAGLLASRLFAEQTVILTSATLTLGGRFDAMAAAWGLARGSYDSLDAGTPFDPAKAGILYTARDLPDPGRDGLPEQTLDEIAGLITAAGGRTLGLFSSRRAAEQAAGAMRLRLPFDVLCQGDDGTGALVERFARSENTCLFGTLSLWQGVDVPGRTCSLVIIDRIPFPRPDDPLLQARKDAADADGRNGFMEVAASHAALLMAQGAGRLLRRTDDRGVVAVLDNRLVTRRYGSFLLRSMPPFWRTSDPAVVRGALERLVSR